MYFMEHIVYGLYQAYLCIYTYIYMELAPQGVDPLTL